MAPQPKALTTAQAEALVEEHFGRFGRVTELPADRAQNFHIQTDDQAYVLRVVAEADRGILEAQNRVLKAATATVGDLRLPTVEHSAKGAEVVAVSLFGQSNYALRLVHFIPGTVLADCPHPLSPSLLIGLGGALGRLDSVLLTHEDPILERNIDWDLRHAGNVVRKQITAVRSPELRALISRALERFTNETEPHLGKLRTSVIHNDANDHNILVDLEDDEPRVVGIFDFGDTVRTTLINEVAIACAYAIFDHPDPIAAAGHVVAGYHATLPLEENELEHLFSLITMRLCVSVCIAASREGEAATNSYVNISQQQAVESLRRLDTIDSTLALCRFRYVTGRSPHPNAASVLAWLDNGHGSFRSVIKNDLSTAAKIVFDLRPGGEHLTGVFTLTDPKELADHLFDVMRRVGTRIGIGRYGEPRPFYGAGAFRPSGAPVDTYRTVHLGIDVFVEPGTELFAPLDGVVEGVQNNDEAQDYGPTLIIRHVTDTGLPFFTLYGHLSPATLDHVAVGQAVTQGAHIGWVGTFPDNGNWAPHLHFQVLLDTLGHRGTFLGVATPRDADFWMSLCPDPNLLLGMPEPCGPIPETAPDETLAKRGWVLSTALSVSYREPLKIVLGRGAYLYDQLGRSYLDCVNNVAHVGHCHPAVVNAAFRQAQRLNTNTRYLHDLIVELGERLKTTLPDELSVCFFVNSGSEANELALRMAQAYTGNRSIVVVDGAYHGNSSALIDISPYKFNGEGGRGPSPHVRVLTMPDAYRHPDRSSQDLDRELENVIKDLAPDSPTFICESILSCGGQIPLPQNFLATIYDEIRTVGGVCVADEVQVGFGRVGEHFWGFELQGVTPDIVTMGKPMGNGHPLAAVVTTRRIADAFNTGMEYFNTFGGNPVSCATGLAVLDVLEKDNLQANAATVGGYLLAGLTSMKRHHDIIGDVRGHGLFLGIELVKDRSTKVPATAEVRCVVEHAKDCGVLLSIDGPLHNVIKIKPPMVFSRSDADLLLTVLDDALSKASS